MPATLESLTNRIRKIAWDEQGEAAAPLFSDSAIEEGIRQALHIYSKRRPLQQIATKTVSADSREIDVSNITGLIDIAEVWCPYTAGNPEDPPLIRGFEYWPDQKILYFPYEVNGTFQPVGGDVIRIFYQVLHTVNELDGATVTTIPLDDETPLAHGAAGYAAQSRARATTEQVTLADQAPVSRQILEWAKRKMSEFEAGLALTLKREQGVAWVKMPPLDRWDRNWA